MAKAFIGLGSNLGSSENILKDALYDLNLINEIKVLNVSSFYKTKPWGFLEQPDFVNAVALIKTSKAPLDLLDSLLDLEKKYKRKRLFKNGPRTLDLDLLSYDDLIYQSTKLNLPHPLIRERAFVLVPWAEIAPDFILPKANLSILNLKNALPPSAILEVVLLNNG